MTPDQWQVSSAGGKHPQMEVYIREMSRFILRREGVRRLPERLSRSTFTVWQPVVKVWNTSRPLPQGSVGSPGVVDHEAPRAVCLTTQNIPVAARQRHGFAI